MAGQLFALEHTAGGRAGAHGTGVAGHRARAVALAQAVAVPAFDGAGVALALRGAHNVDVLARGERVGLDDVAHVHAADVGKAELDGASFGPIILMSLYWRRTNLAGAAAGVASGALSVIIWDYIPLAGGQTLGDKTGLYSLVVGFAVSLILIIIVSLCTKKPSEEMLKAFDDVKNGVNCGCDEKA